MYCISQRLIFKHVSVRYVSSVMLLLSHQSGWGGRACQFLMIHLLQCPLKEMELLGLPAQTVVASIFHGRREKGFLCRAPAQSGPGAE